MNIHIMTLSFAFSLKKTDNKDHYHLFKCQCINCVFKWIKNINDKKVFKHKNFENLKFKITKYQNN